MSTTYLAEGPLDKPGLGSPNPLLLSEPMTTVPSLQEEDFLGDQVHMTVSHSPGPTTLEETFNHHCYPNGGFSLKAALSGSLWAQKVLKG